jgi:hypothetical protein
MKFDYKIGTDGVVTRSDGLLIRPATGAPTPELKEFWAWQLEKGRVTIVQRYMDDTAIGFEFTGGIDSVVSFLDSSNADYANEAKALLAWRDSVWAEFEKIREQDLTAEQLKARLPKPPVG